MSEQAQITQALLSVNYDENNLDYIDSFVPFVVIALQAAYSETQQPNTTIVREKVKEKFGLEIQIGPLNTVLKRAKRRGLIKQRGSTYEPIEGKINELDFETKKLAVIRSHKALIDKFIEFTKYSLPSQWDEHRCKEAMDSYIDAHGIRTLAAGMFGKFANDKYPDIQKNSNDLSITALFCQQLIERDPVGAKWLESSVKGAILTTALYFNFDESPQRFNGVNIFIDSNVALSLLGLGLSNEEETLVKETLDLCRIVGARTGIFDVTVSELSNVLSGIETHLKYKGASLTDATPTVMVRSIKDLIKRGVSASDIVDLSSDLVDKLKQKDLFVSPLPLRTPIYTLDEKALGETIRKCRGTDETKESAVQHDIDVIAGINEMRKGQNQTDINRCYAIFMTHDQNLSRSVANFFHNHFESSGVPPLLPVSEISTIAWLKRPVAKPNLPHDIVMAQVYAAINPSPKIWLSFLKKITDMEKRGKITDKQAVSLRFNTSVGNLLIEEVGDVHEVTDKIVMAVYGRMVREDPSIILEFSKKDQLIRNLQNRTEDYQKTLKDKESQLEANSMEITRVENVRKKAEDELAEKLARENAQMEWCKKIGNRSGNGCAFLITLPLVICVLIAAFGGFFKNMPEWLSWVSVIISVGGIIAYLCALLGDIKSLRSKISKLIAGKVEKVLLTLLHLDLIDNR